MPSCVHPSRKATISMGNKLQSITRSRKVWLVLLVGFLVGVFVTIAEPDLTVLATQVAEIPNWTLIISVALGVGYGLGATAGAITGLGTNLNLVFGGSGIVPAALLAIVLNLVIPKGEDDRAAEAAAAHMAELKAQKLADAQAKKAE